MNSNDPIWDFIQQEAQQLSSEEPLLADFFQRAVLQHSRLEEVVVHVLAETFVASAIEPKDVRAVISQALDSDPEIGVSIRRDIEAAFQRDAACKHYLMPLIYFKGFQALQLYRISHWLWKNQRFSFALFMQNNISERFAVDIHPAARLGNGIMIDHATGLVIGETAIVGNDVSILHSVTLGGSGCQKGDRHPKIGNGVLLAAGAKVLGNISVGEGVKVGAGSLVLESVPDHVTVAGVPAKIVGTPAEENPALEMDQYIE
ncbi:MAG: serine O-acetyltransferase [Porticoccaceae bacterium]